MRIRQTGQRFVLLREGGEIANDRDQLGADDGKRVADEDHIRVVGDIAARRAEVDDPRGFGADLPIGADMRHHVVAGLLLDFGDARKIDVGDLPAHLRKLRVGDGKSHLLLALGQRDPETAPGFIPVLRGKDALHLGRRVAAAEDALIGCIRHYRSRLPCFIKAKNSGPRPEKCAGRKPKERFCTDCCPSARNGPFCRRPCRPAR